MSWVGLDDMVRTYVHALCESSLEGPVNAVAPHAATAAEFAATLGRVLHRPAFLPVPSFGPRLVLGREGAEALVEADQWASAEKLLSSGFEPQYPALEAALKHTLLKV